jgi:hypothetical protein
MLDLSSFELKLGPNTSMQSYFQAVRTLGMWGLFTRGLPLRIIMVGTITGAQWAAYDAFKVFVGL